ncbi:MAG: CopG family antitoxin [Aridibacter sp.]
MGNKNKTKDILPETFKTEAEAGEFWDTHSTMDYAEHLEPSEDKIEIKKRIFEIQIGEDVFQKLQQEAITSDKSIPEIANRILRKNLALT